MEVEDHSYRIYQSLTPSFCFPVDLSILAAEAWTLDFLLSPVALGETCVVWEREFLGLPAFLGDLLLGYTWV